MDEHSLAALEYPAVVDRLERATATPHGAALARGLAPTGDAGEVVRRQALSSEAIALLDAAAEPELAGIEDVRDAAAQAARGGVLEAATLRSVAVSVSVALEARRRLAEEEELVPALHELVAPLDPGLARLGEAIRRAVEDDGSGVRDSASPQLRRLRTRLRTGRHRVAEELRRLARRSELRDHLQEEFVTERGGRPVLAVRASARQHVRGIVHDASSSGQTLFVEPLAVVDLTNELSETASAEREEVERILRDLSAAVGGQERPLRTLVEATGLLDVTLACGILSRRWRGTAVRVSDQVRLLAARHPLLDPGSAVPIDLDLGRLRALVLSGPNTGGKTVALKTLGLAALLHQAGLRPPAESADLPVFDRVLADIGDEQSIEMSLSTFSAHVQNLIAILGSATGRSLVLVDELASGTDPVEGSALARALLARLAPQARLSVVTTHYPELKEWASGADGAGNAATAFDPETHAPLYRVALGRPGGSHALQTAERLGLPASVVARARELVAPERLRIAELLAEAEAAERGAAEARQEAERERARAARSADGVRAREAALDAELERVRASAERARQEAVAEVDRELTDARAELRALREEIRAARRADREVRRAVSRDADRAARERDRRLGAASERATRVREAIDETADVPLAAPGPLAPGDPVVAPDVGVRGTIAAVEGEEAEVVGLRGLRIRVPLARLRPDPAGGPAREPEPPVRVLAAARGDVGDELDVRGRPAQEAREAVRAFVDEAALAGLPIVRVVHGRGSGAVRAAVREELRSHGLVERHEADSADGATIVYLEGG